MDDNANLPETIAPKSSTPILSDLTPGLKSLLTLGDAKTAIERIAATPALLEEARASLPMLKAQAIMPAGPEGVMRVYGSRFVTFPQPKRSEEQKAAWWKDRYDALAAIPEESLEAGMKAWIQLPDARFLPQPGELKALALSQATSTARATHRAQLAVAEAEETARRNAELSPEQQAENRKAVESLMAGYRTRSAELIAARPKVDEVFGRKLPGRDDVPKIPETSDLSDEMRELLGRGY